MLSQFAFPTKWNHGDLSREALEYRKGNVKFGVKGFGCCITHYSTTLVKSIILSVTQVFRK